MTSNEVEYLVILTVQKNTEFTFHQKTVGGSFLATPGQGTRADMFEKAKQLLPAEIRDGAVLFFSAEPNLIPAADGGQS